MNDHAIESYIRAGQIASELKKFARDLIKPEIKLIDIAIAIDDKISEMGAEPAFPVNLSINEIAAHFTPSMNEERVASGILKIDIGVAIDGYIADTAFSIDLTENNEHKTMIELNEEILGNVMKKIGVGSEARDVGNTVQDTLEEWNDKNNTDFSVIKSLSGHQLGQNIIHAGMTVSNYRNSNKAKLQDMAVAIEPFVTTGAGDIYEGEGGGIYVLKKDIPVRDRNARVVMKFIKENYKTRPFCLRWLQRADLPGLKFVLSMLEKQGIIHHYPLLIEKTKAPVSQFENTFLFIDKKTLITTKD